MESRGVRKKKVPTVARRDLESVAVHRRGRRTRLEKFRFDQLEEPVSEKAHPGQIYNYCND